MQVIIFKNGDTVAVMYPAPEYADQIEAVAAKDVPAGAEYRIVDDTSLPYSVPQENWVWSDLTEATPA